MNADKRVRITIYMSLGFIALGVVFLIYGIAKYGVFTKYGVFSTPLALGFGYGIMGVAMLIGSLARYLLNKKSPESKRRFEIAVNDERNIMLENRAKGLAFITYIACASIVFIYFCLKDMPREAEIMSYNICGIVLLYFLYNIILHKKH